jgi:hypothetical protein
MPGPGGFSGGIFFKKGWGTMALARRRGSETATARRALAGFRSASCGPGKV